MFYLIPFLVFIISLIIMAVIILPKLSILANIDVKKVPAEKTAHVKAQILEERLTRKLKYFFGLILKLTDPFWQLVINSLKKLYQRIRELEEKYQTESWKIQLTKDKEKDKKTTDLVKDIFTEIEESLRQETYQEAEKGYIKILSLDPANIKAYEGLGDLYLKIKEYDQAKEVFAYITVLDKNNGKAYNNLGQIAALKGDWQEAAEKYYLSINLNTSHAKYYADLAEAYYHLNKIDQAIGVIKKATQLEPNNPKYLDFLLELAIISNKKILAQKIFQELKKVNPENQKLVEFKKKIQEM